MHEKSSIMQIINRHLRVRQKHVLLDFKATVKAAPHECVIKTGQP